jgi:VWFA-related protein
MDEIAVDGESRTRFVESLEVRTVNVDVWVTDKKGTPILEGLEKGDFQVFEDGREVQITHFRGPDQASEAALGPDSLDAGQEAAQVPAESEEKSPDWVVLFFDSVFTQPARLNQVLDRLDESLQSWSTAKTQFMVLSYDGRINLEQPFSNDLALTRLILSAISRSGSRSRIQQSEMDALTREMQSVLAHVRRAQSSAADPGLGSAADSSRIATGNQYATESFDTLTLKIESYSERLRAQVKAMIAAMGGVVNGLGSLPGRKAMIYVGTGVPMRPGEELFYAMEETFRGGQELRSGDPVGNSGGNSGGRPGSSPTGAPSESSPGGPKFSSRDRRQVSAFALKSSTKSLSKEIDNLGTLASSGRVQIYALQPSFVGPGISSGVGAKVGMLTAGGLKAIQQNNLAEPIDVLAEETGGRAVRGMNADSLFDGMAADSRQSYSLAYAPDRASDGRYHDIEVRLKNEKKTRLRYRRGYLDQSREVIIANRTGASLFLAEDDNSLGLEIELLESRDAHKAGQWILPILVKIPITSLTFLPDGQEHICNAKLYVAAMDPDGNATPVRGMALDIRVASADLELARSQYFSGKVDLLMRTGKQRVAIGFWDPTGGITSFVSRDILISEK